MCPQITKNIDRIPYIVIFVNNRLIVKTKKPALRRRQNLLQQPEGGGNSNTFVLTKKISTGGIKSAWMTQDGLNADIFLGIRP